MPSTPNLNPPASSVAVHAPVYCDPLRAGTPGKDKNDSERGREQVKCVTSRAEAEFRGALDRRLALELTREPGERVGVMLEDGGAVEAVTVAGSDRNEPEWRRAMAEKFFWQRGEGLRKIGSRRRPRNKLGFALQMCVLRYQGGLLGSDVFVPPDVSRISSDARATWTRTTL